MVLLIILNLINSSVEVIQNLLKVIVEIYSKIVKITKSTMRIIKSGLIIITQRQELIFTYSNPISKVWLKSDQRKQFKYWIPLPIT